MLKIKRAYYAQTLTHAQKYNTILVFDLFGVQMKLLARYM